MAGSWKIVLLSVARELSAQVDINVLGQKQSAIRCRRDRSVPSVVILYGESLLAARSRLPTTGSGSLGLAHYMLPGRNVCAIVRNGRGSSGGGRGSARPARLYDGRDSETHLGIQVREGYKHFFDELPRVIRRDSLRRTIQHNKGRFGHGSESPSLWSPPRGHASGARTHPKPHRFVAVDHAW
jgi:hypothetical protein